VKTMQATQWQFETTEAWSNVTFCPKCMANEKRSSEGNILGFLTTRLIWRIERRTDRPTWEVALYERQIGR